MGLKVTSPRSSSACSSDPAGRAPRAGRSPRTPGTKSWPRGNALVFAPWARRQLPWEKELGPASRLSALLVLTSQPGPPVAASLCPPRGLLHFVVRWRPGAGGCLPFPTLAPACRGQPRLRAPKYWGYVLAFFLSGGTRGPSGCLLLWHISLDSINPPPLRQLPVCQRPSPVFDPAGPLGSSMATYHLASLFFSSVPRASSPSSSDSSFGVATPVMWERYLQEGVPSVSSGFAQILWCQISQTATVILRKSFTSRCPHLPLWLGSPC